MKKNIIIAALLCIAFAAGVFAQATVALFPNIQVTTEQRANAVWAVCYCTGYSGAWDDNSAMWTHYRKAMINHVRDLYRQAKRGQAAATQDGADLGVTP